MEMKPQRRRKTFVKMVGQSKGWRWKLNHRGEGRHSRRWLAKVNDRDGNETTEETEDIREDGWTK